MAKKTPTSISPDDVKLANLCTGTRADGSKFYVYLLMTGDQSQALMQAMAEKRPIDFTEYGEVLTYGEGVEPPESVKKEMEEKYPFLNHQFEEQVAGEYQKLKEEMERMQKRGVTPEQFLKQKLKGLMEESD